MKITVSRLTTHSQSVFGKDRMQTRTTFSPDEFNELKDAFRQIAAVDGMEVETESKTEHKITPNKPGRAYYGGGMDITSMVETVSLCVSALVLLFKALKSLSPIIEKYIEKQAGRSIDIEIDGIKISVENRKDLDLAIGKIKELKKWEEENEEKDKKTKPAKK